MSESTAWHCPWKAYNGTEDQRQNSVAMIGYMCQVLREADSGWCNGRHSANSQSGHTTMASRYTARTHRWTGCNGSAIMTCNGNIPAIPMQLPKVSPAVLPSRSISPPIMDNGTSNTVQRCFIGTMKSQLLLPLASDQPERQHLKAGTITPMWPEAAPRNHTTHGHAILIHHTTMGPGPT